MNLSAPTQPVFLIAVILAVLAIISIYVSIPFISGNAFWVAIVAFVLLTVGNVAKGL